MTKLVVYWMLKLTLMKMKKDKFAKWTHPHE